MTFLSDHSKVNTVLLVLMALAWFYTEVSEHVKRDAFKQDIMEFIETIDHDQLLRRVQDLEDKECTE